MDQGFCCSGQIKGFQRKRFHFAHISRLRFRKKKQLEIESFRDSRITQLVVLSKHNSRLWNAYQFHCTASLSNTPGSFNSAQLISDTDWFSPRVGKGLSNDINLQFKPNDSIDTTGLSFNLVFTRSVFAAPVSLQWNWSSFPFSQRLPKNK